MEQQSRLPPGSREARLSADAVQLFKVTELRGTDIEKLIAQLVVVAKFYSKVRIVVCIAFKLSPRFNVGTWARSSTTKTSIPTDLK